MSRSVIVSQPGSPDCMTIQTAGITKPSPSHVLVRHTAIGLNYIDTYHRSGLYPLPVPLGLGVEAVGVIEEAADGSIWKKGDRVGYAGGTPGAYADHRFVPSDLLIPLPDDIDDSSAAAALLKGMTAGMLIRSVFPVQAGQTVLFHAAAGGVGLLACQWLKHLGVRVIGTVGSEEKASVARAHGVAETILYQKEDFRDRVKDLTGGLGVPVVFDGVGFATFERSLDCLKPRGMMVSFGNASGKPPLLDVLSLAQRGSLFLTRPTLAHYTTIREERLPLAEALFDVIRKGAVKILVSHKWPLAEVVEAHRTLERRATIGSSLLLP